MTTINRGNGVTVKVPAPVFGEVKPCWHCHGRGTHDGETCLFCRGWGYIRTAARANMAPDQTDAMLTLFGPEAVSVRNDG